MCHQRASSAQCSPIVALGMSLACRRPGFCCSVLAELSATCTRRACPPASNWSIQLCITGRPRLRLAIATKPTKSMHATFLLLFLLLSGDIQVNPGPSNSDIPISVNNFPVLGSANICGLRSKVLQLQAEYLLPYNFAAFALQETKLSPSCRDPSLQLTDYSLFRKDRSAGGGGVALYVQDCLNLRRFCSHISPSLELIAVEAFFGQRRLILASVFCRQDHDLRWKNSFLT